ncbi:hypothetical protein [Aliarcobacter butzleri]|uniref:hypothetical protein n=1 Tax=Aliarcobacter butzleri TaxID=28197 RepID=UPI00263D438D|nr:hypothetical protein [Aliarcobacter butzleri]MDN5089848.1 hypothetical protein [Aliarcobacter butzleri]
MQKDREENIFYNIIKNETSLTESFCNFMNYKVFRDLFIDIINKKICNKIDKSKVKFQNFDTEVPLLNEQNNGRIDLQLKISEKEIYLFEIKIELYTNLTDNQPKNYLEYLKDLNIGNENLFFIVPKGYYYLSKLHDCNIIYWEDILDEIRKNEIDKINIFINEFCKILDYRWFYFEKVEFTKNEVDLIFNDKKEKGYKMLENVNIPILMNKLFKIVVDTKIDYYKSDKESLAQKDGYFGYFLENRKCGISDKLTIWFGVDYAIWERYKHPLIIQIEPNEQQEVIKLENYLKDKIDYSKHIDEDGDTIFYIPLQQELFENKDVNITQEFTNKIEKVKNLMQKYK